MRDNNGIVASPVFGAVQKEPGPDGRRAALAAPHVACLPARLERERATDSLAGLHRRTFHRLDRFGAGGGCGGAGGEADAQVGNFLDQRHAIAGEVRALQARHDKLAPLFSVKRLFVQRRAVKEIKEPEAGALNGHKLGEGALTVHEIPLDGSKIPAETTPTP